MSRARKIGCLCAAIALSVCLTDTAWAQPGQLTTDNPYIRPSAPRIVGSDYILGAVPADYHLLASHNFPYAYTGADNEAFQGQVLSQVYQQTGTGYLAFAYQFNNIYTGVGTGTEISSVTIGDSSAPFAGFLVTGGGSDQAGASHGVGTAISNPNKYWTNGDPYSIAYNSDGNGLKVAFNATSFGTQLLSAHPVGGPIVPTNDISSLFWITTNAKNYQVTNVGLSDTSLVGTANAYAPATGTIPVPEPSSAILLSLAAATGLVAWRRGRSRK